ncbi:MAG: hypothetical protein KDA89_17630, partial [Planctomycetaceae bacterium]|nr:hypothetical protein [Planctomycetaceae bacterium]
MNRWIGRNICPLPALLVIITAVVIWYPAIPLGVPGEWDWQRHNGFEDTTDLLDRLLPATLAAGLLFSIHRLGLTMLRKPRRCTAGVDEPEQAPTSDGAVRS